MPLSARTKDPRQRRLRAMTGAPRLLVGGSYGRAPSRHRWRRRWVSLELHAGACGPRSTRRKLARFSGGTLARLRPTRTLADVRVSQTATSRSGCRAKCISARQPDNTRISSCRSVAALDDLDRQQRGSRQVNTTGHSTPLTITSVQLNGTGRPVLVYRISVRDEEAVGSITRATVTRLSSTHPRSASDPTHTAVDSDGLPWPNPAELVGNSLFGDRSRWTPAIIDIHPESTSQAEDEPFHR